jgi:hypothetical protein
MPQRISSSNPLIKATGSDLPSEQTVCLPSLDRTASLSAHSVVDAGSTVAMANQLADHPISVKLTSVKLTALIPSFGRFRVLRPSTQTSMTFFNLW